MGCFCIVKMPQDEMKGTSVEMGETRKLHFDTQETKKKKADQLQSES